MTQWAYRWRGVLVSPPLVFAVVSFAHETEWDRVVWPLGSALFWLGFGLRLWAQQHLHYRLRGVTHLTTTGPYAFVRNPIYVGNTLICLGATVVSELLWLAPVTLLWCLTVYALVVRHEEHRLTARYGLAYHRYRTEVPRWCPRPPPLRNLGLVTQDWRASVAAELPCLLVLVPYIVKELLAPWVER